MVPHVYRQIAEAVMAGADLRTIEQTIIEQAAADEELRAVLWLYAQALRDQPHAALTNRLPLPDHAPV